MIYHTQLPLGFFPFHSFHIPLVPFLFFSPLLCSDPFSEGYVFGNKVQILNWKCVCNVGLMGGFLLPPASVVGQENGQHFLLR